MRSILLGQPGVVDAGADWRAGRGWVIFDKSQVSAEALAKALSEYYPTEVIAVEPVP